MNHTSSSQSLVRLLTLSAVFALSTLSSEELPDRFVFQRSTVSLPKEINGLKFVDAESVPDESDAMVYYSNPDRGLNLSMAVYVSPSGTEGPTFMLDANGKKILDEREEIRNKFNAVFRLTDPSESFIREYSKTIESIRSVPFLPNLELESESRLMAIPSQENSPIGYVATLVGHNQIEGHGSIPWTWKSSLFAIPGYFVKINYTFPSHLWMEATIAELKFIQAINWNQLIQSEPANEGNR